MARPQGAACDSGAFAGVLTLTPTPTFTATSYPPTRTPAPGPNPAVTAVNNGDGRLRVTVVFPLATAGCTGQPRLVFEGSSTNGVVDIGSMVGQAPPFEQSLGPGTQTVVFFVRRVTPGRATTVQLHAVDACGRSWPTLVGGGPGAF
ncbi:MAG TPA: hypothetical protein VK066_21225 [Chloroflexota bacterium]|nr:hypothetical protein [Chloroflexota bacterium]